MTVIDPIILELRADFRDYNAKLAQAERLGGRTFQRMSNEAKRLENQMRRSSGAIGLSLRSLAASLGTYFTGRELVGLIDSFTRFQNQLRVAGLEGDNLLAVQNRLRESAARYGVSIEALAELFGKATQAGKDLGASQADLLNLTDATAQALLITGTSSQSASGAILGLSQALASGTVRAEEFNQMNEGGLAPLLQAAAASERFGGSLGKLRLAVVDGTVSSREFYTAVLQNSKLLETQASHATLTLSGAFTSLRNELTLYFGDAAKSNGVTTALSEAIKALADNLETIIPALAVIATLMTGRFLAGMLGGGAALRAITAHVAIATTSMAGLGLAARSAGGAMIAALGGIPGIAITAALAIGYIVTQTEDGAEALAKLRDETASVEAEADRMEQTLRDAGVEIGGVGDAADTAGGQLRDFWSVIGDTITRLQQMAQSAAIARAALIGTQIEEARGEKRRLERQRLTAIGQASAAGTGMPAFVSLPGGSNASGTVDQRRNAQLDRQIAALERQQLAVLTAAARGVSLDEPGAAPAAASAAGSKRGSRGGGRSDRDTAERAARKANQVVTEIEQLNVDRLRSIADLSRSAEDRAEAEQAALRADRSAFDRQVMLDEELSAAQRRDLAAARDAADAQRARAIEVDRLAGLAAEQAERESAANAGQRELTDMRGRVEDRTARERRMTALRLIDLEFSEREAEATRELEEAERRGDEVAREIASSKLARIGELKKLAQEEAQLANMTPIEALRDELHKTRGEIAEDVEDVEVRALQNLEDGMVDAIMGAKSLGDAFSRMADQIIADLARIAIQQAIIAPLAALLGGGGLLGGLFGSIFGGGGAGKILGTFGGVKGFASGGSMQLGGMGGVDSNLLSLNGQPLARVSRGEMMHIVPPNQQMRAPAQEPAVVRIIVAEGQMFEPRVEAISGRVSVQVQRLAAPQLIDAAANETIRRAGRPGL